MELCNGNRQIVYRILRSFRGVNKSGHVSSWEAKPTGIMKTLITIIQIEIEIVSQSSSIKRASRSP